MEYIQTSPSNINKYVNDFHTCVKHEFANSLTKIYNEEISVYRDLIETVVKLPFVQEIINENTILKARLKLFDDSNNSIKLEIHDKPILKINMEDIEQIPFTNELSSCETSDEDEEEEDEEEDDEEDDQE